MMTAGASGTYYFHYIASEGRGGGGFLPIDQDGHAKTYTPQYLATEVIAKEWVQPVDAVHKLFKVSSDVKDTEGNTLVTAYALERPDGQWSVMLVNKDHDNDHSVKIAFADPPAGRNRAFSGTVDRVVFGPNEYQWHPDPAAAAGPSDTGGRRPGWGNGHADPDGPPSKSTVAAPGPDTLYQLPKASIIVLRGKIASY